MTHQVVQTRRFSHQYKKLHDNIAADVDAAIGAVATDPAIGNKVRRSCTCLARPSIRV